MMPEVVILVPVLGRPHRVAPFLRSLRVATRTACEVLFLTDPDDAAEKRAILSANARSLDVDGRYAAKINAGARATTEPFMFLGADDLHFHRGWLPAALALMTDKVGVVGTNDLGNRAVIEGRHSTHSLVARWYATLGTIDDPGSLLHEGYDHNFVDDEFVCTARKRGAFAHARDSIVEHLHPDWGKGARDATYIRGRQRYDDDWRLFRERSHLWA